MELAIETESLGKTYGRVAAVANLSLRVQEGEIYAFLGLNGAGKTTTIRMLLGMIRPTTGSAVVLQTRVIPGSQEPWANVGYLVETARAYPELTVRENLEVARRLHPKTPASAVGQIIEQMGLAAYAERRASILSLGNLQRLGLAKALLHNPRLLLLDEPANGLDPAGIVEIRELLLSLSHEKGVTIFMASHILAEVSRLAQRIGIIHHARLLQELDAAELQRNRKKRLLLRANAIEPVFRTLVNAGFSANMSEDGGIESLDPRAIEHPDEINRLLVMAGFPPSQVLVEEEDLEQYFLRLVGMNGGKQDE